MNIIVNTGNRLDSQIEINPKIDFREKSIKFSILILLILYKGYRIAKIE
jgi:hypothetical protein